MSTKKPAKEAPLNKKPSISDEQKTKKPAEKPKETQKKPEPPKNKENKQKANETLKTTKAEKPEEIKDNKETSGENKGQKDEKHEKNEKPLENQEKTTTDQEINKKKEENEVKKEENEEKKQEIKENDDKNKENNVQIESIQIYNSQNINNKESMKNMKLLAEFFSFAPKNIVEKSQNDSKSLSKNYQAAYEKVIIIMDLKFAIFGVFQQKPIKQKKTVFVEFFTKSSPLISQKIGKDFDNFQKKIDEKSTKTNVFWSFFTNSLTPIMEKTASDVENLKRKIEPAEEQPAPLNSLISGVNLIF